MALITCCLYWCRRSYPSSLPTGYRRPFPSEFVARSSSRSLWICL